MSIGWYNGWSPEERLATTPAQREAVRDGRLTRPTHCSICGSDKEVWFHNERYDLPLEVYPICRPCHWTLHERFEKPCAWVALVERHSRPGAWFAHLTMDPDSRFRPFEETYPQGLPGWNDLPGRGSLAV